ncbi:MAG: glutaredoxin [Porticoccus sp.]|jgi:glutaredoxin
MAVIRWILGSLILSLNWIFSPKIIKRHPSSQAKLNEKTAGLTLFQYPACPFCVKVRRTIKKHSLSVKLIDPRLCGHSSQELLEIGGKLKVPCLKIEANDADIHWMYESSDIIKYLEDRVAEATSSA